LIKVLLVLLCLVLPFLAVLLKKGPCLEVLWAFLLQLLGHIPGVIYGIYQVVKDRQASGLDDDSIARRDIRLVCNPGSTGRQW
jgi:uncharacterized membrane protein YqaE (UPF0057 family)